MKLRCTQDSIRIRLRKSELVALAKDSKIQETITISDQAMFGFSLHISDDVEVNAKLQENIVQVYLPRAIASQWINSNEVGIEVNNPINDSKTLHILIEKDFPCLDREEEDYNDTFFELSEEKGDNC